MKKPNLDNVEFTADMDFIKRKPIKCKHCNKDKGSHLAKTFACPMGAKIRNFGYSYFSKTTVFEPKP